MNALDLAKIKDKVAVFFSHHSIWIWSAILLSLFECGLIAWLHFQHQRSLDLASTKLEAMHLAQIDLGKGFLHVSLSNNPDSPFDREQGLVLIKQATTSYERSLSGLDIKMEDTLAPFREKIKTFEDALIAWDESTSDQAKKMANLRIAFFDLEQQTDMVDMQSQQYLNRLSTQLNNEFMATFSIAAIFLAGICGIVFLAERSRARSEARVQAAQAESQRLLAATETSRRELLNLVMDQQRAEQQILRLNSELENRVLDRTMQLKAANEEMESFVNSVTHDLRAPLRTLNGFSDILLSDYSAALDDQAQHYLTRIRDASQRMGHLINDLLDLSRVTQIEFTRQQVDLSTIARDIASSLTPLNAPSTVKLEISDDLVAEGDPHLLRIVLENLLTNAFKFTSHREQAHIVVGKIMNSGKDIFFVQDNGAGFDMQYADRLFTPFQRLHSSNEFPGTGIGLVTVKRIIARHGGRIWPEAAVDQGATFYFTLGDGQ